MSDPVLELLKSKGVPFTISGRDYVTKCFNPEHNDTNPSFRIDRTTGVCHCFSCGFKTNIFKHYGILTNNVSIKVVKLKEKLKALSEVFSGLAPLDGAKPVNASFRGISVKTLKEFEAFTTDQDEDMVDRIIFPIKDIKDRVTAYVGRHSMSNGNPRYLIRPAHAVVGMYPAKVPAGTKSLILVEGIFDLLNMWEHGAKNTICTFGTSKLLKDTSSKLMPYKVMGVENVFILYDGDKPGRDAATTIKPLIEEAGFTVEIINLPEGEDPGSLDSDNIESIIQYTK